MSREHIEEALRLVKNGHSYRETGNQLGMSRSQIARIMWNSKYRKKTGGGRNGRSHETAHPPILSKETPPLMGTRCPITSPDKTVEDCWYKGRRYE